MGVSKREPTIEELLSDPMMVTVLQHARKTPDELRAMLRDVRERRQGHDTDLQPDPQGIGCSQKT